MCPRVLTPKLTGAAARSAEGTNIGHENAEGMAYVGVRVERPVRQGSDVEGSKHKLACILLLRLWPFRKEFSPKKNGWQKNNYPLRNKSSADNWFGNCYPEEIYKQ